MRFKIFDIYFEIRFSFILIISFAIIFELNSLIYVLIFSVLHEIGHISVLFLQHKKAEKIIISFNGIGLIHNCRFTFWQEIAFLSAGIMVNFLFAVIGLHREINIALFIVNALPIYPLDGGRLLKLVLNKILSLNFSDTVFKIVSAIFIMILIFISIYFRNFNLFLISIYSVIYSINNSID